MQQHDANNRANDSVIQRKCPSCTAWYETERKATEYTEKFTCDCGQLMIYTVPAKPITELLKPKNEDLLAFGQDGDKLDTGMTAREATERARIWWEKTGRSEMRLQSMRQAEAVGGSNNGAGAMLSDPDPASHNHLPSGIVNAMPWDSLTKAERAHITKTWHHFHVRNPDLLDEGEAEHKMQDRGKVE